MARFWDLCRWVCVAVMALGVAIGTGRTTAKAAAAACSFDAIVTAQGADYETPQTPTEAGAAAYSQLIGFLVSDRKRGLTRLSVYMQHRANCEGATKFSVAVDGITRVPAAAIDNVGAAENIPIPPRRYHSVVVQLLNNEHDNNGLPSRTYILFALSGWQTVTVTPSRTPSGSPAQTVTFANGIPSTRSLSLTKSNLDKSDFPTLFGHLIVGSADDRQLDIALAGNPSQLYPTSIGKLNFNSTFLGDYLTATPSVESSCDLFASAHHLPSKLARLSLAVQVITINNCNGSGTTIAVAPPQLATGPTPSVLVQWDDQGASSVPKPPKATLGQNGSLQLDNIIFPDDVLTAANPFSFMADVSVPLWDGSPTAHAIPFELSGNALVSDAPIQLSVRKILVTISKGLACQKQCSGAATVDLSKAAGLKAIGKFAASFTDGTLAITARPDVMTFVPGAQITPSNGRWSLSLNASNVNLSLMDASSTLTWPGINHNGLLTLSNFVISGGNGTDLQMSGSVSDSTAVPDDTTILCSNAVTTTWSNATQVGSLNLTNGSPVFDVSALPNAHFSLGDPMMGVDAAGKATNTDWIYGQLPATASKLLNLSASGGCNLQGLASEITTADPLGVLGRVEGHNLYASTTATSCPNNPTGITLCLNADIMPKFVDSLLGASDTIPATVVFVPGVPAMCPYGTCFSSATLSYQPSSAGGSSTSTGTPKTGGSSSAGSSSTPVPLHVRLGAISLQLNSATLLVEGSGSTSAQNFGLANKYTCNASLVGKMELEEDVSSVYSGPTSANDTNVKPVKIEPEIAIGRNCFILASEGAVGVPLSPQSSMSITHFAMAHFDYQGLPKPDGSLVPCDELPSSKCTYVEHLELAGLLHSGQLIAVVQNAGYDRDSRTNQFKLAFSIDKKTTLALNAVNNADQILQAITSGVGALVGGAIHL